MEQVKCIKTNANIFEQALVKYFFVGLLTLVEHQVIYGISYFSNYFETN